MECSDGLTIGNVLTYGVNMREDNIANCVAKKDAICTPNSKAFTDSLSASVGNDYHSLEFADWHSLYATPSSQCNESGSSHLFIQYTCVQSEETLATKYNRMCLVSATAILIAFLFTITIRYLF